MNFLHDIADSTWIPLPNGIVALLVLILGWCAAIFIRLVLSKVLDLARFNQICEKTGISDFLRKGQVSYSPAKLAGVIAYWIVVLVALFWSAKLLNIDMAEPLSARLVTAIPGFVSAMLILVVGVITVSFIGNFVMTIARNASFPHAQLLSQVTKFLGFILVFSLTLEQIDIGTTMIASLFQIVLGAVAFGVALAFGLGCKDMARDAMERFLHELKEKSRIGGDSDMEG
ncbi:MAG: hypothetical protein KKG09_00845 [Verrucomicrobia bacterium]|nr:hypothetical protein [Verrucomicrobiota bacterium]MBU4247441.1 hypothetical protein [Verrucomicrobiota bacterium]MBU4290611.1 hypothetical protein [Verrucomicrobiota bacterium]MBU4496539.1 hypothetical protein [Verrucomicrobiota bacterium]MCG2679488.1 hypothetical protein [Kiritimatiellia bacterium]